MSFAYQENIHKIYHTITYGAIEKVEELLREGVHIDSVDVCGRSLLFLAAVKNRPDLVLYFYQRGLSLNIVDKFGYSPLDYVFSHHHTEVAKLLALLGADFVSPYAFRSAFTSTFEGLLELLIQLDPSRIHRLTVSDFPVTFKAILRDYVLDPELDMDNCMFYAPKAARKAIVLLAVGVDLFLMFDLQAPILPEKMIHTIRGRIYFQISLTERLLRAIEYRTDNRRSTRFQVASSSHL